MEDNQSWLDNNKENQFSVMLYSWLLKMTSTMPYAQLCKSQNRNMKEPHLPEMEISVMVVHKNWCLTVSYISWNIKPFIVTEPFTIWHVLTLHFFPKMVHITTSWNSAHLVWNTLFICRYTHMHMCIHTPMCRCVCVCVCVCYSLCHAI